MKKYITLLTVTLATIAGMAQSVNDTINRMVLVESTYNPVIEGTVKRSFIPEEVKPSMNKENVVYANETVGLTNFDREARPAEAVTITPEKGTSGYAHLGYGNYNNLSGLAAYKFRLKGNKDLAFKAHIDGWNGKYRLPSKDVWRSHLYDMGLEGDYSMQVGQVALNAGLHAAYYNYNYNYLGTPSSTQQANNLGANVGIKGSAGEHYYYHAMVNYTRFGRSTCFGQHTPHSESHIHSEASFGMDLYDWGMASVLISSDILTYRGLTSYHDYHVLGITPRWDYRYGDFRFVSGLNLDFLMGKGISHPVQASPECSISYIPNKPFSAQLTLDGGRSINTFEHLYTLSPYWAAAEQIRPEYTFMNAHLEGNLRITEGLHLHFGGGYKILSNALFEYVMPVGGIIYTGIINHNAQVATADVGLNYNYKELFDFSAKGAYRHWMLQGDRALLARAPQVEADADARVRIIPNLYAYTNLKFVMFTDTDERAIIDWSLGANYALNKRFSFFLDAHNLLGRSYSYYTGYSAQGFHVLAGAMVKF